MNNHGQSFGRHRGRGDFSRRNQLQEVPEPVRMPFEDFSGGFDARTNREATARPASMNSYDVYVSDQNEIVRLPGVAVEETMTHTPGQIALHPALSFQSELVMFAPPYIGIRRKDDTTWYNVGLETSPRPYTWAVYGETLVFSNGNGKVKTREPLATTVTLLNNCPQGRGFMVFGGRFFVLGASVNGNYEPLAIRWNDTSGSLDGWDEEQGSGTEFLLNDVGAGDRIVAGKALNFGLAAIFLRRSIWTARFTGIAERPADFAPTVPNVGAVNAHCIRVTRYGAIFLADDGVHLFDGNSERMISAPINPRILPLDATQLDNYRSAYNPIRQWYYLFTPTETFIYDLKFERWYRSTLVARDGVMFPEQSDPVTWDELTGSWDQMQGSWDDLLPLEQDAAWLVLINSAGKLGLEDDLTITNFGVDQTPYWEFPRQEGPQFRWLFTYREMQFEYVGEGKLTIWLPDIEGDLVQITSRNYADFCVRRARKLNFIQTGQGMGARIDITGTLRVSRFELHAMPRGPRLDFEIEPVIEPLPDDTGGPCPCFPSLTGEQAYGDSLCGYVDLDDYSNNAFYAFYADPSAVFETCVPYNVSHNRMRQPYVPGGASTTFVVYDPEVPAVDKNYRMGTDGTNTGTYTHGQLVADWTVVVSGGNEIDLVDGAGYLGPKLTLRSADKAGATTYSTDGVRHYAIPGMGTGNAYIETTIGGLTPDKRVEVIIEGKFGPATEPVTGPNFIAGTRVNGTKGYCRLAAAPAGSYYTHSVSVLTDSSGQAVVRIGYSEDNTPPNVQNEEFIINRIYVYQQHLTDCSARLRFKFGPEIAVDDLVNNLGSFSLIKQTSTAGASVDLILATSDNYSGEFLSGMYTQPHHAILEISRFGPQYPAVRWNKIHVDLGPDLVQFFTTNPDKVKDVVLRVLDAGINRIQVAVFYGLAAPERGPTDVMTLLGHIEADITALQWSYGLNWNDGDTRWSTDRTDFLSSGLTATPEGFEYALYEFEHKQGGYNDVPAIDTGNPTQLSQYVQLPPVDWFHGPSSYTAEGPHPDVESDTARYATDRLDWQRTGTLYSPLGGPSMRLDYGVNAGADATISTLLADGGVDYHWLFQAPVGTFVPGSDVRVRFKFRKPTGLNMLEWTLPSGAGTSSVLDRTGLGVARLNGGALIGVGVADSASFTDVDQIVTADLNGQITLEVGPFTQLTGGSYTGTFCDYDSFSAVQQ